MASRHPFDPTNPSSFLAMAGRRSGSLRRGAEKPFARRLCWRGCLTGIAAIAVSAPAAWAQAPASVGGPGITIERYSEDWSVLADPRRRTGRWTEPFKYFPLNDAGDLYLTTGLEARTRYESYQHGQWGQQPRNDYLWNRVMPYADLHMGQLRVFAQPIISDISGADRVETPVDTTGVDFLQGFVGLEMEIASGTTLDLAAGRRLRSLGGGRLVDTRYGVNVPLAFDGADVSLTRGTRRITALGLRPVENRVGDFDDRSSDQKALWGLYGTQWLAQDRRTGVDLYWLGFRDRNAVYDQGSGRQTVHSFGMRWFGVEGDGTSRASSSAASSTMPHSGLGRGRRNPSPICDSSAQSRSRYDDRLHLRRRRPRRPRAEHLQRPVPPWAVLRRPVADRSSQPHSPPAFGHPSSP